MPPSVSSSTAGCSESWPRRTGSLRYIEFRDRKLCTLEGVVFSSCAIHVSPRPSSTHCRILDACGFSATLLFPKAPFSFTLYCFLGHMYHFLLPDARCIGRRGRVGGQRRRGLRGLRPRPWADRRRLRRTEAAGHLKRRGMVRGEGS